MSASTVTLPKPLPDRNNDGQVNVSAAGAKKYGVPRPGVWLLQPGGSAAAGYTYWIAGYSPATPPVLVPEPPVVTPPVVTPPVVTPPVVTPPPVTPAAGLEVVSSQGHVFARNGYLTVGVSGAGTLGSTVSAPAGWPATTGDDTTRVGLLVAGFNRDVILQGAVVEQGLLGASGKLYRQTGYGTNEFVGSNNGLTWTGVAGPFKVEQTISLLDNEVVFTMRLTNASSATLTDVRYMRSVDFDQAARTYANVLTIAGQGANAQVTAAPAPGEAGPTMHLASRGDTRAVAAFSTAVIPRTPYRADVDAPAKAGTTSTGDYAASIAFKLDNLAPGSVAGLRWVLGAQGFVRANSAGADQPADVRAAVLVLQPTSSGAARTATPQLLLANALLSAGFNDYGGVGVLGTSPPDFPTARNAGIVSSSFYLIAQDLEFLAHGALVEGFAVGATTPAAKRAKLVNYRSAGWTGFGPGTFSPTGVWTGTNAATGLRITQGVVLEGTVLRYTVTLTNTSQNTLTDLRYMRSADPDMDDDSVPNRDRDAFGTDNKVLAQGPATVVAGMRGVGKGWYFFMKSPDANSRASFYGFINSDPYAPLAYDTPAAVGTAATASGTSLNLCWALPDLLPGASATLSFLQGVAQSVSSVENMK